jgi:hypothetical protein
LKFQGFVVEEVPGFSLYGDVDVHSVTINALPPMHPSYVPELVLEQGRTWKAPWYPTEEIDLFVGVMSSSNHFSERMAVRKTWFQSHLIQSSKVVARFFVALVRENFYPSSEFFFFLLVVFWNSLLGNFSVCVSQKGAFLMFECEYFAAC